MATEDCCVVCADPMDWTGFGPCGHKEACSRCVSRMRFVLGDKKCVMCREENPLVFFTRFSGDYTARLTSEQFSQLKVGPVVGLTHAVAWCSMPSPLVMAPPAG